MRGLGGRGPVHEPIQARPRWHTGRGRLADRRDHASLEPQLPADGVSFMRLGKPADIRATAVSNDAPKSRGA